MVLPMRIVCVEDDNEILTYISKGLKQAGHTVDSADNGKDGLFLATTKTDQRLYS